MPIIIVYITQYLGEAEGDFLYIDPLLCTYVHIYMACMCHTYVKSQQSLPSYVCVYIYRYRCMCTGAAAACTLITTAFTIHYTSETTALDQLQSHQTDQHHETP